MSSIEEIFNNGIGYNDRLIVKNELLTDVEVLNRYQKNGIIDLLYCRLLINMFDFQKYSYVIIKFDDDENYVYHEYKNNIAGGSCVLADSRMRSFCESDEVMINYNGVDKTNAYNMEENFTC